MRERNECIICRVVSLSLLCALCDCSVYHLSRCIKEGLFVLSYVGWRCVLQAMLRSSYKFFIMANEQLAEVTRTLCLGGSKLIQLYKLFDQGHDERRNNDGTFDVITPMQARHALPETIELKLKAPFDLNQVPTEVEVYSRLLYKGVVYHCQTSTDVCKKHGNVYGTSCVVVNAFLL